MQLSRKKTKVGRSKNRRKEELNTWNIRQEAGIKCRRRRETPPTNSREKRYAVYRRWGARHQVWSQNWRESRRMEETLAGWKKSPVQEAVGRHAVKKKPCPDSVRQIEKERPQLLKQAQELGWTWKRTNGWHLPNMVGMDKELQQWKLGCMCEICRRCRNGSMGSFLERKISTPRAGQKGKCGMSSVVDIVKAFEKVQLLVVWQCAIKFSRTKRRLRFPSQTVTAILQNRNTRGRANNLW